MPPGEETIGVVGAGTMGIGIAETALLRGYSATVVDSSAEAIENARGRIESSFARAVERGRCGGPEAEAALENLELGDDLGPLVGCDAVIEAVSERLEVKQRLFDGLLEACRPATLLATNTSSLRVSTIAAGTADPARIVGMHFFNPVPRMELVEVIPGIATEPDVTARARRLGEGLGKRVIVARDGIGFLVNRAGRPFVGEALRLVQEQVATPEQVDRVCRLGGGFRMGPFELADLIGNDVNLEITESFWFQSYGEPRWRPSHIQRGLVDAGRLGRKSGIGFYDYSGESHRAPDPEVPMTGGGEGRRVAILGAGQVAVGLRERSAAAGFPVDDGDPTGAAAWLTLDARTDRGAGDQDGAGPRAILCAGSSLTGAGYPAASGFHLIGPTEESRLVELTRLASTDPTCFERTVEYFVALGYLTEEVGDAPGLVLGRIVSQLVNEAAFMIGEGLARPSDIDTGATFGLNYPRGPVAWAAAAGLDHIRAVLGGLEAARGEERYRPAPLFDGEPAELGQLPG